MTINYNDVRKDGRLFLHIPEDERPHSYGVEATDDSGNSFLFRSDGQTVKPTDFYRASMANGNEYGDWNRNGDKQPAITHPLAIHRLWGDNLEEMGRDIETIQAAIRAVTSEPVHFDHLGATSVAI